MAPDYLKIDGTAVGGGASASTAATAAGDVTVSETGAATQRVDFTMDGEVVAITNGSDTGSLTLGSLGRDAAIFGVRASLAGVKDGTGAITTTDIDFGIGTAVTDGQPFSANEDNIVEKIDFNDDALTVDLSFVRTSGVSSTVPTEFPVAVVPDDDLIVNLYLNVASDGSLTLTGTISVFFIDLGIPAE